MIHDRAFVFADAAADAQFGIDVGPGERDLFAPAVGDGDFAGVDGFGRGGADFFADHAGRVHGPGQAAPPVVKGRTGFDRAEISEFADAEFLRDGDFRDGAGGADLSAQGAVEFAVAHPHIHNGRPDAFHAGFKQGGLEDVGGAHANALVAFDAALQKFDFGHGPGRADDGFVEVFGEVAAGAGKGEKEQAGEAGEHGVAAFDVGIGDFVLFGWKHFETEGVVRAVVDAVEADEALGFAQIGVRVGSAFTALEAEVAVHAFLHVALDAPDGKAREHAQCGAQRADVAAEKPGNDQVHRDEKEQDEADDPAELVHMRAHVHPFGGHIDGGQNRYGEGAIDHHDGIEQADLQAAEQGSHAETDEDEVFDGIAFAIAVAFDFLLDAAVVEKPADELVEGAVGTDPVAEKPAQDEGGNDQDQGPEQAFVQGVGGDGRGDGDQGIDFEQEGYRVALEVAELGDEYKKEKQAEEKCLGDDADARNFHL